MEDHEMSEASFQNKRGKKRMLFAWHTNIKWSAGLFSCNLVSLCLPVCQLGAALKPRCDQHIITMALMQIVPPAGEGDVPSGRYPAATVPSKIHLTCSDCRGAATTSLSRYIHTAPYAQIVCHLWPNGHILSLWAPSLTPLWSPKLTTSQQPSVRSVIVEASPDVLFRSAKNKAEHLFWFWDWQGRFPPFYTKYREIRDCVALKKQNTCKMEERIDI